MNNTSSFCKWQQPFLMLALICCIMVLGYAEDDNSAGENTAPPMLTLDMVQERVLTDNPSLQAVEMRVRQAGERVRQARAAYFPSVNAEWNAVHTALPDKTVAEARQSIRGGFTSTLPGVLRMAEFAPLNSISAIASSAYQTSLAYESVPETMDNYSVSLSVGYLLFNGFGRKHANAMARFAARETQAAADEAKRLLLEAAAQTYFGAQLAGERVAIAMADKAFNQRLRDEARMKQQIGAASLSEALNFEVRFRASEAQLIAAEQDRDLALIALAAIMGMENAALPADAQLTPLETNAEQEAQVPEYDACYEQAFARRPDLEANRIARQRTQAHIGLQQAAYYPTLTAFAAQEASREGNSRFESDEVATSVGVGMSYTLFEGGKRRAQVAEARQAHKEAGFNLKNAEIAVSQDIREALVRLRAAQRQLALQRENADYVARNRDMAEQEFQAGQTSLALLNQAQRDLVEAQSTLALARVSLLTAWHGLQTATAETLARFEEPAEDKTAE